MKLFSKFIVAVTSIVVLVGVFQYIFFQNQIKSQFQEFLVNQEMGMTDRFVTYFENYFEAYGTFANVEQVLQENQMMMGRRHAQMMGNPVIFNQQMMIADKNGGIVADSDGNYTGKKATDVQGIHRDLIVDGEKIGELIIIRGEDSLQQNLVKRFIHSTTITILLGTLIGSMIAVLVGFLMTKGFAKPVEKLLEGIRRVAAGDTTYRVTIDKKDEFYPLSKAFNHMAEQLEQNEKLRQNLMADVAHELRTPLAIIRGKLESIQEGVIKADEKEIILLIDEVYRLSRLVNDLQQLSLAEAGKLPLNKQPIDVNNFIEKVSTNFMALSEEKGIILRTQLLPTNIVLALDEDRMTQVIVNLLDNALRHTPINGEIKIKVEEDTPSEEVIVTVSDTGSGIDEKILPTIFDRFARTDMARNRQQGGAGLGLSIAKGFVEAHGGSISAASEIGKGTTFTIRLPKE